MTKKDYVRAAKLIRLTFEHKPNEAREETIYRFFMSETVGLFCTFFQENPSFEASKFISACYEEPSDTDIPLTLKVYCKCGECYKLAEGESFPCDCGRTVKRPRIKLAPTKGKKHGNR